MTPSTKIHPVRRISKRKVGMCGPYAVAGLTGRTLEEVVAWINYHQGWRRPKDLRRHVGATGTSELRAVLYSLGYETDRAERRVERLPDHKREMRPTLKEWYHESEELRETPMLVTCRHHWIAVHRGYLVDTYHPEGKHILSSRHLRARVRSTWFVTERQTTQGRERRAQKWCLPPGCRISDLR